MGILRSGLIALSRSRSLQEAIVRIPISRRMARRFVAGESLSAALDVVQKLNARGFVATIDHLGENVTSTDAASAAANEYLAVLDALILTCARCNVSVKLTHMGLDLGDDVCYANIARIVRYAAEHDNFVRIDMEGSPYTGRTLAIYRRLRQEFPNCGIVIQSALHRSQADVEELIAGGIGHFRLCKGAYDEPATIAYRERPRVTQALNSLIHTCMESTARENGTYAAIASHDSEVIDYARALAYRQGLPPTAYEVQMLYGIRQDLQAALARQGLTVRIYVPYGTHWYPYFMRRLAERPANLLFFLRALVGQ